MKLYFANKRFLQSRQNHRFKLWDGFQNNYYPILSFLQMKKSAGKFYAVIRGLEPGIYTSWAECSKQVDGYRYPKFKSFKTEQEAQYWLENGVEMELPSKEIPSKRSIDDIVKQDDKSKKFLERKDFTVIYTDGSCS